MTDKCLNAFLNDPYTKKTEPKMKWMGQYRAIQTDPNTKRQTALPMTLLKIDKSKSKNPENYWKDVIQNAGLFMGIWGDRIMFSRFADDAMGFGPATKDTPSNQRVDVYKINPHWLSLCLDGPEDARYLFMRNPFVGGYPLRYAEGFTNQTDYNGTCPPPQTNPQDNIACPPSTYSCASEKGYCYDPNNKKMVSTYFINQYDNCPENSESTATNKPYTIDGVRVWNRQDGLDMNAGCQTAESKFSDEWTQANNLLRSGNVQDLTELQNDLTQLRTLQSHRGEENRQELEDLNALINAKDRYIDLIKEENNDWDLTMHAIIVFFFVLALSVFPWISWVSQKISFKTFVIIEVCMFLIYIFYLIYQIRRTGVKDFTDPTINKTSVSFKNLSNFLEQQANAGQTLFTEYINENCLCPTSTTTYNNTASSSNLSSFDKQGKMFYIPDGMVYNDIGTPNQTIDPQTKLNSSESYYFTIEWEDAWNNSTILANNIPIEKVNEIMRNLSLPNDSSSASRDLAKAVMMSTQVQSSSNPFGIPVAVYVKLVLEFIYRDKRVITTQDIIDGVKKFENGTYPLNDSGSCAFITSIFNSTTFALTFGSVIQWFRYICSHPFKILPPNETLTRRL